MLHVAFTLASFIFFAISFPPYAGSLDHVLQSSHSTSSSSTSIFNQSPPTDSNHRPDSFPQAIQ